MKRAFVFIDGSNFYYRLKSIADFYTKETATKYSLSRFNFKSFCQFLVDKNELKEIHYYVGQIKRAKTSTKNFEKVEKMYADQQRLTSYLNRDGIVVRFGKLMKDHSRPDAYHEKGVDVQIAVEMIRFARQNKYDVAYLISSDTDLVPAVEEVRDLKKEVTYVGIKRIPTEGEKKDSFGLSYGLIKVSTDFKLIEKEQVKPFMTIRGAE